jgi:hypothetical protein
MTERTPLRDRSRRPRRFFLGALIAAVLALSVGGCIIIQFGSQSSTQLNTIGTVQITSTFCASDKDSSNNPTVPSGCAGSTTGGNTDHDADTESMQVLIGYRIPTCAGEPSSFTSADPSSPAITFNEVTGYASKLESAFPTDSDLQWVGYRSTAQSYAEGQAGGTVGSQQYVRVQPQFTLTQGCSGTSPSAGDPFQGPFLWKTVVGERRADATYAGTRVMDCGGGSSPTSSDVTSYNDADKTICVDFPTVSGVNGANASQDTRDLGVVNPDDPSNTAAVTIHAGATKTVPFTLKYRGTSSPAFSLSTTNTVAFGSASIVGSTTITPATDSDNTVNVSVTVPPGSSQTSATVTLTATCTSPSNCSSSPAQTRSLTRNITIAPNFAFDPAPTLPSLGTVTLTGDTSTQVKNATMSSFGVNDTTCSPQPSCGSGWNVTVVGDSGGSAVFKQYCPSTSAPCTHSAGVGCGSGTSDPSGYVSGGCTQAANSLTLNSSGASWSGGTGTTPTFPCNSGGCAVDSSAATKIASAANGGGSYGMGLWTAGGFSSTSLRLSTPTTLRVLPASEQYHADVVWTLNSGP